MKVIALKECGQVLDSKVTEFSDDELRLSLQRKWHLVYDDGNIPHLIEVLEKVVPSRLSETERDAFIRGSLEEAKHAFIKILNSSWTKTAFYAKALDAGVEHGLLGFNEATRGALETVIRQITD